VEWLALAGGSARAGTADRLRERRALASLRERGIHLLLHAGPSTELTPHPRWNCPRKRALTTWLAGAMSGTALPGNAMMKRLVFLLLLGSCAGAADTPPDPALRDVKISYVHAAPDWIRQRGEVIGLARSRDRTLACARPAGAASSRCPIRGPSARRCTSACGRMRSGIVTVNGIA